MENALMKLDQAKSLPKQFKDNEVDEKIVEKAVQGIDFKPNHLKSIIKNKTRVIRNLPKGDLTNVYLVNELRKIAAAYGGDKELSAIVQKECVKVLKDDFKGLSIAEVWIAFRLHSSGELRDEKGRGEMYGGKMTAKSLAAVLGAWKSHRAKAVANYINIKYKEEQAAIEAKKGEELKRIFWPNLIKTLKRLIESEKTDWRDCPAYIFDSLRKAGVVDVSDNWKSIWEDAKVLAMGEVVSERAKSVFKKGVSSGSVYAVGEAGIKSMEGKQKLRAKHIAKQLSLFRLVIKNKNFKLDSLSKFI